VFLIKINRQLFFNAFPREARTKILLVKIPVTQSLLLFSIIPSNIKLGYALDVIDYLHKANSLTNKVT
jgi:hypothetical protein